MRFSLSHVELHHLSRVTVDSCKHTLITYFFFHSYYNLSLQLMHVWSLLINLVNLYITLQSHNPQKGKERKKREYRHIGVLPSNFALCVGLPRTPPGPDFPVYRRTSLHLAPPLDYPGFWGNKLMGCYFYVTWVRARAPFDAKFWVGLGARARGPNIIVITNYCVVSSHLYTPKPFLWLLHALRSHRATYGLPAFCPSLPFGLTSNGQRWYPVQTLHLEPRPCTSSESSFIMGLIFLPHAKKPSTVLPTWMMPLKLCLYNPSPTFFGGPT